MSLSYYFEARVKIPKDAWLRFMEEHQAEAVKEGCKDAGGLIVKLLEGAGLRLEHSAVSDEGGFLTFYNFWEIGPDANNLARAELAVADKVIWGQFVRVLERTEDKDFLFSFTDRLQTEPPGWDLEERQYVRVQYDLRHSSLAEMKARIDTTLAQEGKRLGWYLGRTYMTHSGRESQLIQLWCVPPDTTKQQAEASAASFSWLRAFLDKSILDPNVSPNPEVYLLSRSSYDK